MSSHNARLADAPPVTGELPPGTVGLLGGAFDPPHVGHLTVAREALAQLQLRQLLVVVTGQAPHKTVETPAWMRFRLAKAAFEDVDGVQLSRVELDRDGPSYTLETVLWARERYGDTTFIVGADEFASFLTWHEPDAVLAATRLAVATRPGFPQEQLELVLDALRQPERVHFFAVPKIPASSSEIRRRVGRGESTDGLVPSPVRADIDVLGLYCDAESEQEVPSSEMNPSREGS